jgi:hypothetical protein
VFHRRREHTETTFSIYYEHHENFNLAFPHLIVFVAALQFCRPVILVHAFLCQGNIAVHSGPSVTREALEIG